MLNPLKKLMSKCKNLKSRSPSLDKKYHLYVVYARYLYNGNFEDIITPVISYSSKEDNPISFYESISEHIHVIKNYNYALPIGCIDINDIDYRGCGFLDEFRDYQKFYPAVTLKDEIQKLIENLEQNEPKTFIRGRIMRYAENSLYFSNMPDRGTTPFIFGYLSCASEYGVVSKEEFIRLSNYTNKIISLREKYNIEN